MSPGLDGSQMRETFGREQTCEVSEACGTTCTCTCTCRDTPTPAPHAREARQKVSFPNRTLRNCRCECSVGFQKFPGVSGHLSHVGSKWCTYLDFGWPSCNLRCIRLWWWLVEGAACSAGPIEWRPRVGEKGHGHPERFPKVRVVQIEEIGHKLHPGAN